MPSPNPQSLADEFRLAASEQKLDLELPDNAFLVFRQDPQGGWIIKSARDYMTAEQIAASQATGKSDVYVLSANPQHGLLQLVGNRLKAIKSN